MKTIKEAREHANELELSGADNQNHAERHG